MNYPTVASPPGRSLPRRRKLWFCQFAWFGLFAAGWFAGALPAGARNASAAELPDGETLFETQIRPVLVQTCVKCHGGEKTSGGLDVRSRDALVRGGESGPAISLDVPEQSLLLRALRREPDVSAMPPEQPLPAETIAAFAAWLAQGAVWPESTGEISPTDGGRHWAFQPLGNFSAPTTPGAEANHPIDRFLEASRSERQLAAAAPAPRTTSIRRLYFDLWGLPPAADEVASFLADDAPDAWPRLVDRLLAAPQYGQRWGRHWLDLARYADTAGDNADYPVPELALYRDWVIAALNADLPYDAFLHQQIAGDLLAADHHGDDYAQRVVATGFLALSRRYATAPYELWHLTLEDTIDTLGRAVLGLTMRCARCHDHKYDPLTMRDYYAVYGVFSSTRFPYAGSEEFQSMNLPRKNFAALAPPRDAAPHWEAYQKAVETLRSEYDAVKAKPAAAGVESPAGEKSPPTDDEARKQQEKRLRKALRALAGPGAPEELRVAYAVAEGDIANAAVQKLGEPSQPGDVVPRGVPALFGPPDEPVPDGQSGRLQLARWLTGPAAPLTARVIVNRLWQHHFGRGLVGTPSNFGLRGETPSHPELLDWLAQKLIDSGWSLKTVHRLIVTSQAYQLSSIGEPATQSADPDNRWLARQSRRRLDAESLRDAVLWSADRLDLQRPAAHPFPTVEKWNWTQHAPFRAVYPSQARSVYLMTQRIVRHPYLSLFDAPDPNTTSDQRTAATVPLQALYFLNDPWFNEQAEQFGRRVVDQAADDPGRLEWLLQRAWSRRPTPFELQHWLTFHERQQAHAIDAGQAPAEAAAAAWTSVARVALSANEFVYVD